MLGAWSGAYAEYYAWPLFNARAWQSYCWLQDLSTGTQVMETLTPGQLQACRATIQNAAADAGVSCLVY